MFKPEWCCFLDNTEALEGALAVLRAYRPKEEMCPRLSVIESPNPRQFVYRHPPVDFDPDGAVVLVEGVAFDSPVTLHGWPGSYGAAVAFCPLQMHVEVLGAADYLMCEAINFLEAHYDQDQPFPVWWAFADEASDQLRTGCEGRHQLFDFDGFVLTSPKVAGQDFGDGCRDEHPDP